MCNGRLFSYSIVRKQDIKIMIKFIKDLFHVEDVKIGYMLGDYEEHVIKIMAGYSF